MIDLSQLIAECAPNVGKNTMFAIIQTESSGNPIAIRNNTTGAHLKANSLDEAISIATKYIDKGHSLDLGIAQINSKNLKPLGLTIEKVFEPCTNLKAAAQVLAWGYERARKLYGDGQDALLAALSAYNTGSLNRGFRNGYVQKVVANANGRIYQKIKIPDIELKQYMELKQDSQSQRAKTSNPFEAHLLAPENVGPIRNRKPEAVDPRSAPLEAPTSEPGV